LDREEWFMLPKYLGIKFPALSEDKAKQRIFDKPQILKFKNARNDVKSRACNAFIDVVKKFLGNAKIHIMKRLSTLC
jgi:hypothetical protein